MLPFDSEHLTEPEREVQRQQERRDCRTCRCAHYNPRSGALTCLESDAPSTADVISGAVVCEWFE
jgi:hypothetical protein